jgi:hypothetical protein
MEKLGWLKFSVKLLPVPSLTFEVSAVPKPQEPPDGGGTGAESWTVPADPEGNEFCVLRPKETLIRQRAAPGTVLGPCSRHERTF